jgi:hypothetical protein
MKMRNLLVFGLALVIPALPALADDWLPPEWRGDPGSTIQGWHFSTADKENVFPDYPSGGGWLPSTKLTVTPDPQNPDWIETDPSGSGRTGIWPLSGWIDVTVDNFPKPNPYKEVWVQLTWASTGGEPAIINIDPSPKVGTFTLVNEHTWCMGWTTTVWKWRVEPNPSDEMFRIQGDILVDQLVIDTICAPEPGTMFLLGLAALGTLIRRRRKA